MMACIELTTNVFNFYYLLLVLLTLIAIIWSGTLILKQLKESESNRLLALLKTLNYPLFSVDHFENRRIIYQSIPIPTIQSNDYADWLKDHNKFFRKVMPSSTKNLDEIIESELLAFNLAANYLFSNRFNDRVFFDVWWDVLGRFCILLSDWIIAERDFRGKGYLDSLIWLFKENTTYLKNSEIKVISMYQVNPESKDRIRVDFTLEEIEEYSKRLQ